MKILDTIDNFIKGAKTYLAAGTGVIVVAALQSQGIDAVGVLDTIQGLLTDAVTLVNTAVLGAIALFRKAMPDKRS